MIVVFDAHCLFCSGWVHFLLKHDRRGVLNFASMQGANGRALLARAGLDVNHLDTLLLVDGSRTWRNSAALFRVLHALGWPWRLAWAAWLVPAFVRDSIYRWVALNRYRMFGRSESCMLPPAEFAGRFLD